MTRRQRVVASQAEALRAQATQAEQLAATLRTQADVLESLASEPEPAAAAPAQRLDLDAEELTTHALMALLHVKSRKTVNRWLNDDPTFPKPRKQNGLNRWLRQEVDAWRAARQRAA